jgi:hypothetical protein
MRQAKKENENNPVWTQVIEEFDLLSQLKASPTRPGPTYSFVVCPSRYRRIDGSMSLSAPIDEQRCRQLCIDISCAQSWDDGDTSKRQRALKSLKSLLQSQLSRHEQDASYRQRAEGAGQ